MGPNKSAGGAWLMEILRILMGMQGVDGNDHAGGKGTREDGRGREEGWIGNELLLLSP